MTDQVFSQGVHLAEKPNFYLLRLYIEQEVPNGSLQKLNETIENSKNSEVSSTNKYNYIHTKQND